GGVLVLMGCAGCLQAAAEQERRKNVLKDVGQAYLAYDRKHLKPPEKPEDLQDFLTLPEAKEAIKNGTVLVLYNTQGRDIVNWGAPNCALAYEQAVLNGAGAVARGDGSAGWMNRMKFNELANAGAPAR